MFIFLDEAGNFKSKKESYFIVGGFITGDPKRTAKTFRKWQTKKFPAKIRYKTEVKFSDSGLNENLRLATLKYFCDQDMRIFYSFLNRLNIPPKYRKKKQIQTGLLYAEIVGKTLSLLLPANDSEFRVFRDRRHLKNITEAQFNEALKLDLLPALPAKTLIQIEALDSAASPNIQIADWICGALFRYHNQKESGVHYFSTLKNSIIASEELFEAYWINLYKNKKSPHKS